MNNYIQIVDTLGAPDKAIVLAHIYPDAIDKEGWLRLAVQTGTTTVRLAG